MNTLLEKLNSRKLWVAGAGMLSTALADKPILSAIIGGVYVIVQGIIDATRARGTGK